MTYANKFGKICIYTDGTVYKWFKDMEIATTYWNEHFAKAECAEEWLEDYDTVELKNMITNEVIAAL